MEAAASFSVEKQVFNPLNKQPDRAGEATYTWWKKVHPAVYVLAEYYFSSYYPINTYT